ncbi:cysteine proteinase [Punctularia strigosozonata HHB-11173 SS5]|uniref:cysteine proteinase n=1 Tax=Punctularia strigosozonata (strain HHB-11173) TaxID=741275 RepID=UPI0004416495|nr:cysteine proteinase [Punctularia strigosozonata HHB-11173 SS5]EIN08933.1 cysteine proteinase [Punctularia strigosozonata HHB-11173 SS5]
MAKGKKPTPQEIYREKKEREAKERSAYLPPGLVNHGNTCFMNSTLQGLIATRFLYELGHFNPVPDAAQTYAALPILAQRSPLLTNGHGLGGGYEHDWEEGMPLGDAFLRVMQRAWDIQDSKSRASMSPKEVLTAIGTKFDQYLDFRQQDAHEFLRQLLDAMRMEELDIIKKRQPPPAKDKRKRRRRIEPPTPQGPSQEPQPSSSDPTPTSPPPPAATTAFALQSLSDMLFGGKLESFVVCERCNHVSRTLEDFNDLSLSIKPEDYARERKRDRIKTLAKKFKFRSSPMGSTGSGLGLGTAAGSGLGRGDGDEVRASSVPPSPMRRNSEARGGGVPDDIDDSAFVATASTPRRRSIDLSPGLAPNVAGAAAQGSEPLPTLASISSVLQVDGSDSRDLQSQAEGTRTPDPSAAQQRENVALVTDAVDASPHEEEKKLREHVEFSDAGKPDREKKEKEKEREKKDDDSWARLGRRLSMFGRKEKDKERNRRSRSRERSRPVSLGHLPEGQPAFSSPATPRQSDASRALSPDLKHVRPASAEPPRTASPALSIGSPHLSTSQRPDFRRLSSSLASVLLSEKDKAKDGKHHHRHHHNKPYKSYKPSKGEVEYLHRILADVGGPSANPFAIFRAPQPGPSALSGSQSSTAAAGAQNLWAKLAQLTSLEECLRLFTSVEVLDGENMVGCRRCWKIEHGLWPPRTNGGASSSESETESDDGDEKETVEAAGDVVDAKENGDDDDTLDEEYVKVRSGSVRSSSSTAATDSSHVLSSSATLADAPSDASISSVEPTKTPPPVPPIPIPDADEPATYGGQIIPSISTTAPDSPAPYLSPPATARPESIPPPVPSPRLGTSLLASSSRDSLRAPDGRRRRPPGLKDGAEDSEPTSQDDSDSDETNSTYTYSDVSAAASPVASPMVSPSASQERLAPAKAQRTQSKIPRSKQVIMRRSFKRYLIAVPPPVLVIHLKRFQQISKVPALSFSSGFKKLDDYVAFPEYLDLTPYLAPNREEFGLGSKHHRSGHAGTAAPSLPSRDKSGKCMYRLYAVVQHLGNMLGGHYVAYVALPPSRKDAPVSSPSSEGTPRDDSATSRHSKESGAEAQREWAYVSDTVVRLTTLDEVLKAKAYICMYERI